MTPPRLSAAPPLLVSLFLWLRSKPPTVQTIRDVFMSLSVQIPASTLPAFFHEGGTMHDALEQPIERAEEQGETDLEVRL